MEKETVISNYDRQVDIGRRIFMEYDQDKIIRKFRLLSDHQWIFLDYLNTPYRISRTDGTIEACQNNNRWLECRSYDTRKFRLLSDHQWIFLDYLNTPYRISRTDGTIEACQNNNRWLECRSYDTVMTIYDLLCYAKNETAPTLCGEWQTIGNFIEACQNNNRWLECRSYDTVMTIYDLLCYAKNETAPTLCGEWQTIGNFAVGSSPDNL